MSHAGILMFVAKCLTMTSQGTPSPAKVTILGDQGNGRLWTPGILVWILDQVQTLVLMYVYSINVN